MAQSFHHYRLDNGLTLLVEPSAEARSFAAGFFVHTGSRDETAEEWGLSHFLEHMCFKGDEHCSWKQVNEGFDALGARYNAFTTQEMTCYYGQVIPEFSHRLLQHLGRLMRPALRLDDFLTEKKVILEEIAMYNDDPQQRLYERLMAVHFASSPLGRSVIGTPASLVPMSLGQMEEYYRRRYSPGNVVLAVAGACQPALTRQWAEELCGAWTGPAVSGSRDRPRPTGESQQMVDPKLTRHYLMAMTPGPSAQDEDRFAARVLADVLGDSEGSRLYWALVDPAIAEDADFGFYPHDGCGSFYLSLVTDFERRDVALERSLAELNRVGEDLTDAEVERARNKIATQLTLAAESPSGRMKALGSQWLYNRDYRSLDDDMRTLQAIDRHTIVDLLRRYPLSPLTTVSLGRE